jgi:hypothetical protein
MTPKLTSLAKVSSLYEVKAPTEKSKKGKTLSESGMVRADVVVPLKIPPELPTESPKGVVDLDGFVYRYQGRGHECVP